ncbi:hypothetical protein BJX61DRAFT_481700 [Aspergillus egyptiacus]|nr:hypothetical protein BJX61DRAFT_481700 [Aspergillus egyptiacus]
MDLFSRMQLLFAQEEGLLQIDTHLHSVDENARLEAAKANQVPHSSDAQMTCLGQSKVSGDNDKIAPSTAFSPTDVPPSPHDGTFCPLAAISRFPYHHIRGDLKQRVASKFFDKGQFWERDWDLYYIHATPRFGGRHLLLVPASQVRHLLKEINKTLDCSLSIPSSEDKGLLLNFNRDGFPQPIFLGRSTDRASKDSLESTIPPSSGLRLIPNCVDDEISAFEKMMEAALSAAKSKSKSKAKKQRTRFQREMETSDTIRRVQCYLGLRADSSELIECNWGEQAEPEPEFRPLTLDQPAPYPFHTEPVFISLDVEVNERCHTAITEVGISTLDTRDLIGVAPGPQGENWQSRIRSRHLRVEEYRYHANHLYVRGCPDKFEFGTSEFVRAEKVSQVIQDSFADPAFFDGPDKKLRPLVLVGHSLISDIQYLELANVHIIDESSGASKFADRIDTADSFQMIRGETDLRSLGSVIGELGMTGWNLHNAGNDARYTLQALVAMLVEHSKAQTDLQPSQPQ